jgi:hypothetical protein
MAYLAERTRVIPGAVAAALLLPLALALALGEAACGSITAVTPGDGAAPRDGGPDAAPEVHAEARAEIAPPEAGAEVAAAEAHPEVDTRDCTIKINEVQTGGSGGALDEFIELYNTCPDRAFPLSGYALVYRSDAGTTNVPLIVFGSQAVTANRPYYLCANGGATYTGPPADSFFTASGLRDVGGGLAILGPGGAIVDSVGWGTATNAFVEGTAAAAPAAGQSIARVPDGRDTGANATDFVLQTAPTPGAAN